MKKFKKIFTALLTGILLISIVFIPSVGATEAIKKIEAHYQNIKIVNNGLTVTIDPKTEPFIVNGTTYIPLRMMGELYNKTVNWNAATKTITVTDNAPTVNPSVVSTLTAQLAEKNAKIAQLEADLEKLRADNIGKKYSLSELERQLNKDYWDYDDIDDVEIFLAGDKDDIDVRIDVNKSDWEDISDSSKRRFLQEIVDDILDEFSKASVDGTVKDERNGKLLATFKTNSSGTVSLKKEGADLDDLEDELNDDYGDYRYIDDVEISLDGDEDDIDITIEVEKDDWDALDEDEKLDFLQDIVDDILREYKRAFIDGVVEDDDTGKRLDTFYADGDDDGDVTID